MENSSLLHRPMLLEEFLPLVGKTLLADCEPRPAELILVEASAARFGGQPDRPPFTLIFRSSPAAFLVSGSYAMRAGEFGPALIYISEIAPPAGSPPGHYYQAVFN
jgi:hypothetical protein